MGMQIDSSTDRHTAHCSVMQSQWCVIRGEISGQLRETWALRIGLTGSDRAVRLFNSRKNEKDEATVRV